jgi:hypothetical protein
MSEDEQRHDDSKRKVTRLQAEPGAARRMAKKLEDSQFEARRGAMRLAMQYVARHCESSLAELIGK